MTPVDAVHSCSGQATNARCEARLPDNPQCAPNYHFGMLLGVEDFRAEQGFHVGRLRRHQRLLHGAGVVAGFPIDYPTASGDLRVGAGYAIDPLGRDLTLASPQCVNLALWWAQHAKDEAFDDIKPGITRFDLDLVIHYANCLDRPVPAIAEPCAGSAADTAHSRICETVKLSLVRCPPNEASAAPPTRRRPQGKAAAAETPEASTSNREFDAAYARLQALMTQEPPTADAAHARELMAHMVAALSPFSSDAEQDETHTRLTLARLRGVQVVQDGDQAWRVEVETLDLGARQPLLPASLLQDLLLARASAVGPMLRPDQTQLKSKTLRLVFNQALAEKSVTAEAFTVSEFIPAEGWKLFSPSAACDDPATGEVTLTLDRKPSGERLRITVIGTGSTPLLGNTFIPAGALHPDGDGRTLTTTLSI